MTNQVRPYEAFRLGPAIMKTTITDTTHRILLNVSNKIRKNKQLKSKNDYRRNLAGNLSEEYNFNNAFTSKGEKIVDDELRYLAHNYTKVCSDTMKRPGYIIDEKDIIISKPGWVNFMKPGEWNPAHTHTGQISCVLFLKVPPEIEKENRDSELCKKSNTPSAGRLEFMYGEDIGLTATGSMRTPKEKDIYFFPARLTHMVYPFKSNVERVSVSYNFGNRQYARDILDEKGEGAWG